MCFFVALLSAVVQCPKLSDLESGSMNCSDPLGPLSYQSTCVFTCAEGYALVGSSSNTLQCEGSGQWNDSLPLCVRKCTYFILCTLQDFIVSSY